MKRFEDYKLVRDENEMERLLSEGWIVDKVFYVSYTNRQDTHGNFMGNSINNSQYVVESQPHFIMKTRGPAHEVLFRNDNENQR